MAGGRLIRVATTIRLPRRRVWDSVRDISSHVNWMEDAVAIRFTSPQREGVGTSFVCDTKVGPIRLADHMTITEWQPRKVMGVHHTGLVTGTGRFLLMRRGRRGTRFIWEERLSFPVWLASPILRWIWKRNLRNLKQLLERR